MDKNKNNYEPIKNSDAEFKSVSEYANLLESPYWKSRRKEILEKDGHKCTACSCSSTIMLWNQPVKGVQILRRADNNKEELVPFFSDEHIALQVHHKLYVLERDPWNYNNEELVTLCFKCHIKEHKEKYIPVYLKEIDLRVARTPNIISCPRCGGEGHLPEFNYYQRGVCFGCQGRCFVRIKN